MNITSNVKRFFTLKTFSGYYRTLTTFIKRRPITSFIAGLGLLFLTMILGTIITPKQKPVTPKPIVKSVQIYKIGTAPRLTVQAKIEKSGVIKLTSLTSGVVESINIREGDTVGKGANLITLASNYAGGNAPLIQAAIAERQYATVRDTFKTQKELIQKQRDVANNSEVNAEKLRDISNQSIGETQDLLNQDQDIISTLNHNLDNYVATNSGGVNDAIILQTKEMRSQFQSAINGLNQALRSTQYQSSDANPPAEIARIQKEITLKQLDIQEKTLELNKEVTRLQAVLAEVNAAVMHPTAPLPGTVQRIYVREGQAVSPGTPLLLLSGNSEAVTAVALVSENIAKNVSFIENSTLYFGSHAYDEFPFFVSTEATDSQLFSIQFTVPTNFINQVADGEFISVTIPLGYPNTNSAIPFVPLDALYQSQEQAYLFVVNNGKAVSRVVNIGQVFGRYAEISSGLKSSDQVILNRNIIAGDLVSINY